jgi:hypothetical protein
MIIDIQNSTKKEILAEYEECEKLWSRYSGDDLGYYMMTMHKRILELGGFTPKGSKRYIDQNNTKNETR